MRCEVVGWTNYKVTNENGISKSGLPKYKFTLERVNGNYKIVSEVKMDSK